jgi:plastocyanin
VKWINLDTMQHEPKGTVFDSGPLNQNGVFEYTFNQTGTYNYTCAIHPLMRGTITVV